MKHYKAVFDYIGGSLPEKEKDWAEFVFVNRYNLYCDSTNPLLESWNAAYTGPHDGGKPGSQYDSYIREKARVFVENCNDHLMRSPSMTGIEEFYLDENLQFKARLRNNIIMGFHLEEY